MRALAETWLGPEAKVAEQWYPLRRKIPSPKEWPVMGCLSRLVPCSKQNSHLL